MFKINNSVKFSILVFLYIVNIIFSLNFTSPAIGVNDDEFFEQLVSGSFTGYPESYTHIAPASPQWLFGFLVSRLYLINNNFSWYFLFLAASVVISLFLMNLLIWINNSIQLIFKVSIFLLNFYALHWFITSPTYTSSAFYLAFAGIFLYIYKVINDKKSFIFELFSGFFLSLSVSTRTESFIAAIVLLSPIIISLLYLSRKRYSRKFISISLILLPIVGITFINFSVDRYYMAKTNWQTYNEFNQARYKIQDNELERIIFANLNKTKWTKDKFELFNSYNFVDYTSFEGKELNSLIKSVDYLETTRDLEFNDLLNRWKTYANYFYYLFFVSVLLIIYSIIKQLFLHKTVKNHLIDMSSILLFVIVWVLLIIYITTYLRLPERIVFPILSTLTYGVILNEFRSSSVKRMTQLKNSSIVIQTFLIIIIFFCVNLDFYKIYNLRINPAYKSFWSEQRISLLALNEGKIFIGNASQVKSVWSNPYKINTVLRELNYLPLGWYTFSPYWTKRAHNLGLIGNSVLNNINSNQNIYWLSDDEYTNYLINHNNDLNGIKLIPTKVMTKTFDFGEYSVYRFTRLN